MSYEFQIMLVFLGCALAAGFIFGLGYFAAVRRTTALVASGSGWRAPAALTVGRLGLAILLFVFAAKLGAGYLLAAFAGFLIARWKALRTVRSTE
jgi:hypothetical protein